MNDQDYYNLKKVKEDIVKTLGEIENNDDDCDTLENAMVYFCSNWDKCEGMKKAILMAVDDQFDNHPAQQDIAEWNRLSDILNGAI